MGQPGCRRNSAYLEFISGTNYSLFPFEETGFFIEKI
jgi:hypothetical protein